MLLLGGNPGDLILGLGFRDEVIDPRVPGDRGRRQRVVTGHHDRSDSHPPQVLEPFMQTGFDRILEIDQRNRAAVVADGQRGSAFAGNAIRLRDDSGCRLLSERPVDGVDRSLLPEMAVQPESAHPRLGAEGDQLRPGRKLGLRAVAAGQRCVPVHLDQRDDALPFWCLITE